MASTYLVGMNESENQKVDLSYLASTKVVRKIFTATLKRKEKRQTMKLQINVPVRGLDLAGLLQGEEGLFLCQNRGQDYIAVAKAGHEIAYWFVTKISNSTEFAEFRGTSGAPGGSRKTS